MLKLRYAAKSILAVLMIWAVSARPPLAEEYREPPGTHRPGAPVQPPRPYTPPPTPAPGSAIPGAAIELVPVPAIKGDNQARAEQRVAAAHLTLKFGNGVSSAGDTVMRQSPEAGKMVSAGTVVEAWFEAMPRREATVPPIIGKTRAEAEQLVVGAHLTLRLGNAAQPAEATVISQFPEANATVTPGTAVEASFAVAPPLEATVPLIIGKTRAEAQQLVVDAHLTLRPGNAGQPAEATVISQIPQANTIVTPGTTVEASFAVPPIIRKPPPQIRPALQDPQRAPPNDKPDQNGNDRPRNQPLAPCKTDGTCTGVDGWKAAGWCAGALLVVAAVVAAHRWKYRLRVKPKFDSGTQWIASSVDPVGPVLGIRVRNANPVVELSWAESKERPDA